jgi:hypothetical protein
MRTSANRYPFTTNREGALTSAGLSDCRRPASEEMQKEHNDADYQQEVNEPAGNVKGHEPEQPKYNQDRRE